MSGSMVQFINLFFFNYIFQYDLSVTTFSPEGKIFQVEYATKAVEASEF